METTLENIGGITLSEKNPTCPRCKKDNVALIFWGYPGDMDWYLQAIKDKEIVGGGCCVSNNDPKWACTDCYHRWGERYDDE
jgi:transposase